MKKSICMILCMVLLFGTMSQAIANDEMHLEEVSAEKTVKPIAYTHDFDGYGNVVGVLNSDGTKTAYLFSSAEQAKTVEAITQLAMPEEFKLQQNSAVQTRGATAPAIMDAPVYSDMDTTNYGSASQMVIGEVLPQIYGRAYMKFDLSFLIAEEISYYDVLSACLYFTEVENQEIDRGAPNVIEAYLVDEQWSESTITWENKPDYYGYEMIGCANVGTCDEAHAQQFTNRLLITKAVMAWLQGLPNNGILLKEKEDQYESCFYTSEDRANRPYVTVTYSFSNPSFGQGIVNNQSYYIVNKETGNYLTSLTGTTNSPITQEAFSTNHGTTQQWKFTKNSANTGYNISLANTSLRVRSTNSGDGANLVLGNQTNTSYQLWKPVRNWNGTYHFQTNASSGFSMKANGGTAVVQTLYGCDFNHYDEWTLIPVNKGTASFFDFDIDIDTTYGTETMSDMAEDIAGYSSASVSTNGMAIDGFQALQNSGLFYFSGHGQPGKLNFLDYNHNTNKNESLGDIVVSNDILIDYLDRSLSSINVNDLAQLQLAFLSSCDTGRDPVTEAAQVVEDNMTGRLYQLGVHNIVSHYNNTGPDYATAWDTSFMTELLLGRSLKVAKLRADNYLYDDYYMELAETVQIFPYGNTNERHDLGDESSILGFTANNALAKNNYSSQVKIPATTNKNALINKELSLPRDVFTYNSFEVYMDNFGGIYWYYAGTNVLHSYEPYTEDVKLGNTVVNGTAAMQLANAFLTATQYDVTGYQIKTSNDCSKNYTIEFYKTNPNKKLVFHMQADESGEVYINNFAAYVADYD